MALAPTVYLCDKINNHLRNVTAWTMPSSLYVKLHTASPGATGATAVAGNTTTQTVTFGTASSGGSMSNTAQVQWTNVSTTETYTHISLWDNTNNCVFTGDISPDTAVTSGGTFTIGVGSLVLAWTVAS